jgi:hypothetical protein
MFGGLLIKNLLFLNNMELLVFHYRFEMHKNMQHYLLTQFEKDLD